MVFSASSCSVSFKDTLARNAGNIPAGLTQNTPSPPGSLVSTYGSTGKSVLAIAGSSAVNVYNSKLQADGKLVLVGSVKMTGSLDWLTARLNTDGSFDTSFNGTGYSIYSYGSSDDELIGIDIQSDGKILTAGIGSSSHSDITTARWNSDGTLDTTFNGTGIAVKTDPSWYNGGYTVKVQSDGKILVGGYLYTGGYKDIVLRYNTDGTPDTTFNSTGVVLFNTGTGSAYVQDISIQSDGKIMLAGGSKISGYYQAGLARLNADGTFDTSFDGDGKKEITISTGADAQLDRVEVLSNGKILSSGRTSNGSNSDGILFQLNSDGSMDSGFGSSGIVTFDSGGDDAFMHFAIDSNGRIIVAGRTPGAGSFSDGLIWRFNSNGSIDTSFGTSGHINLSMSGYASDILSPQILSDGKIWAVGSAIPSDGAVFSALIWP